MSEKRFTVMKKFDGSYVICDKGKMLVADDCCDLLNKLAEENEELGISIKLFEDDIATKDKKIEEQQATIEHLTVEKFKENKRFTKLLSEQQATINKLKAKLKEKEEDEQLYANEILELREANKEFIRFKELGGDY